MCKSSDKIWCSFDTKLSIKNCSLCSHVHILQYGHASLDTETTCESNNLSENVPGVSFSSEMCSVETETAEQFEISDLMDISFSSPSIPTSTPLKRSLQHTMETASSPITFMKTMFHDSATCTSLATSSS